MVRRRRSSHGKGLRMRLTVGCLAFLSLTACAGDLVRVTGTVRYYPIELGFWAVEGDDKTIYDPTNLPSEFAHDGLRVFLLAKKRPVASFHLVGPVVEVLIIQRL